MPGFDENNYANNAEANTRTWASLSEEILAVRNATKLLFASFSPVMLAATGMFNNNEGQLEKLGFIIAGHMRHHFNVAEERYL